MSLPKISSLPTKTKTLPVSKKKVKFRPFLVKEEKILIMTKESDDSSKDDVMDVLKDLVEACTFGTVNVFDLPPADVEFLFLQIRMLSKGQTSKFVYVCRKQQEDSDEICGKQFPVSVNLDEVDVTVPDEFETEFNVPGHDYMIKMESPNIKSMEKFDLSNISKDIDMDLIIKIVGAHISMIIDSTGDEPKHITSFTENQIVSWIEDLPSDFLAEIFRKSILMMPYLGHSIDIVCPCGKNKMTTEIRGIENFFA